MKYAIIAAGEGSRLAKEGVSAPKPLVKINGEILIDRLIETFMQNGATEINVICNEQATEVSYHIEQIKKQGLKGMSIPLNLVVKSTPSSMHSAFMLLPYLESEPFVLTTVDTIFKPEEFASYISTFSQMMEKGDADGLMGVTDYIDDESPLYIETAKTEGEDCLPEILNFLDKDDEGICTFISGGIYGLSPIALKTLRNCIESGNSRMRNFQRALIADGLRLKAFPFSKILDIDHATDIVKAEDFLNGK